MQPGERDEPVDATAQLPPVPAYAPPQFPPPPEYPAPPYPAPGYGPPQYGPPPTYGQQYGPPQYGPAYGAAEYPPPGYGPPVYAPPPPPAGPVPARRTKRLHAGSWILIAVVTLIAVAVVAVFAIRPSPLFKKVLDPTAVAQTIQSQSANGNGNYTAVSCPANERVKAGTTFECTAAGNKRIRVTILHGDGTWQWSPVN